jgi:hypothetical protein
MRDDIIFPRMVGENVIVGTRKGIVTRNKIVVRKDKRLIRVLFSDHQYPLAQWCEPEEVEEMEPDGDL